MTDLETVLGVTTRSSRDAVSLFFSPLSGGVKSERRITVATILIIGHLLINIVVSWLFSLGEFPGGGVALGIAAFVSLTAHYFILVHEVIPDTSSRRLLLITRPRNPLFTDFLENVLRRYSHQVLFIGLCVYYSSVDRTVYVVLAAIAMSVTFIASYTGVRGGNLILSCKSAPMGDPEVIGLLIIGALAGRMEAVLWVITAFGQITIIQRIYYVSRELKRLTSEQPRGTQGSNHEVATAKRPRGH